MYRQRRALTAIVATLALIGGCFLLLITQDSLRPSERSNAERLRMSVKGIGPGTYRFVKHPIESGSSNVNDVGVLFIRELDGKLRAFYIPTVRGVPTVPVDHAWQGGLPCEKFEPDFKSKTLACRDLGENLQPRYPHSWSFDGHSISHTTLDLDRLIGTEENDEFVLFEPAPG